MQKMVNDIAETGSVSHNRGRLFRSHTVQFCERVASVVSSKGNDLGLAQSVWVLPCAEELEASGRHGATPYPARRGLASGNWRENLPTIGEVPDRSSRMPKEAEVGLLLLTAILIMPCDCCRAAEGIQEGLIGRLMASKPQDGSLSGHRLPIALKAGGLIMGRP